MSELSSTAALWIGLAALPILLAACTAFTKVSVVLSALRTGLGAEAILPWSALLSLSLLVTAIVMGPIVGLTITAIDAVGGLSALAIDPLGVGPMVLEPITGFLREHASGDELAFFADLQGVVPEHPLALVPAFLVTELCEAFEMAVLVLVPLVVVDLLVAQGFALAGVPDKPLPLVTLPAKLLLFLAVNGWDVVIAGLVEGYR
ncbi:MAG: hypothetical protein KC636_09860 [Myxococcales bacterium]|nr:hypothetical protein [Myxococcales bacterium]